MLDVELVLMPHQDQWYNWNIFTNQIGFLGIKKNPRRAIGALNPVSGITGQKASGT